MTVAISKGQIANIGVLKRLNPGGDDEKNNDKISLKVLRGRYLFALEEAEDGTLSLVKLRITDPRFRQP
ncbi:MAG: hypothetical protein JW843_05455 [Candidatus Aminicenantes bacterium]|nr:hypothetical protein [Candidatus Aminicenantes bacterium]